MTIYVSDKLQATAATVSGDPTPTTSWQWLRNNSAISGATSSDYVVSADDVGANISVIQSAINMLGTAIANSASDGPVQAFTPSLLFRGSTAGTWYEPADMTTLFRDAAGTLPVTAVEQPVGLMLDKSKGLVLGSELVTNGDFSAGSAGWLTQSGWSIGSGQATAIATNGAIYQQNIALSTSRHYQVSFDAIVTSGAVYVIAGSKQGPSRATSGRYTAILSPSSGSNQIEIWGSAFSGSIDNISVRELPGNHAFNPSGNSANFPVLSARYNLLTKTEDFSDAVWVKDAGITAVTPNYSTAPDGTTTSMRIVFSGSNQLIRQAFSAITGIQYTSNVWLKGAAGTTISVATAGTDELVTLTGGWQQYSGTKSFTNDNFIINTYSGATARDIQVWHPDIRAANDALNQPAYQRVNTATDYDTVGFKPYLRFNGTNQWLQTNSIDFTGTDKMFVSAGVRKLSDPGSVLVCELSTSADTNSGAFYLAASAAAAPNYQIQTGAIGTRVFTSYLTYTAPITNVIASQINNTASGAADIMTKINGIVVIGSSTVDGAGASGNFGNYPLYIGARAGSSLWFNGRLYSLIVAGKLANAVEITETEKYVNGKTAAY